MLNEHNLIPYHNSFMQGQRRHGILDAIRLIACMMIVLMHSPMPGLGTPGFVLCGISYLTASGIGLYL